MAHDHIIEFDWLTRVSAGQLLYLHRLNGLSTITLSQSFILPRAMSLSTHLKSSITPMYICRFIQNAEESS